MSRPTLAWALRDLVWSIDNEVALVTSLSRRVDDRVATLNAARSELAERLARLDDLVAVADSPALRDLLRRRACVRLPVEAELLPGGPCARRGSPQPP